MKSFRSLLSAILVMILVCTMSVSAFAYNDVDPANDNLKAIEFVDKLGILPSTWNGDFQPEQYFTRADAVIAAYKMLYGEAIDPTVYESTTLAFNVSSDGDIEDGSTLASYLMWAVDNYLITTNVGDAKFRPAEAVTANELMTILAKITRLVQDPEAIYPDAYTDAFGELAGDIEAGDVPVTREQAAVAIANALVCEEDGTAGEIGVYEDFDGNPLTSLAVKAQRMSSIDLVIRATSTRKLGYDVKNGTLLSNGMDVALGEDLSDYVGYSINITYRDEDGSKTLTEDETILAYSIGSASSTTIPFSSVKISSGNTMVVDIEGSPFNINTSTFLYLNDNPWPINNKDYDLTTLVPALGAESVVGNRPNLQFKCMYTMDSTILTAIFASEARPAKIVGINNGIYSVFDYYKANSANAVSHYNVTDCVFSGTVKVGDYVNFYESNGKCHFTPGTTILSAFDTRSAASGKPTEYILKDGTTIKEHAYFSYGIAPLVKSDDEYLFVVDDSGENYMLTWERYQSNHAGLFVKEIVSDDKTSTHTIKAFNPKTNADVEFKVLYENVDSATEIVVGDYINYSDNGANDVVEQPEQPENAEGEAAPAAETEKTEQTAKKELVVYVTKDVTVKTVEVVIPEGATNYILDTNGNTYYLNQVLQETPVAGTATITLDMAGTVVKFA